MSKFGKARVPPWTGVEIPVLDAALCNGCGRCVDACPTACLAMGAHHPWLPRPADCVSCVLCVAICPTAALRLELTPLAS
jgi:formate hydrogenlyase subunit 6/NADH:ubiquinone oxidoreductase subunit I